MRKEDSVQQLEYRLRMVLAARSRGGAAHQGDVVMHGSGPGRRLAQVFLGLNLATLIRAARRGPLDAASRSVAAYQAVEPLGDGPRQATVSHYDLGPPDRPGRGDPREDREAIEMLGEIPPVGLAVFVHLRTT